MKKKLLPMLLLTQSLLISGIISGCGMQSSNNPDTSSVKSLSTEGFTKNGNITLSLAKSTLTEKENNSSLWQISYFPYERLKDLAIDKNADSDKIKETVSILAPLEEYLELKGGTLETEGNATGLVLNYEEVYEKANALGMPDNPFAHAPYYDTRRFNNSLLLMLANDYISYVKVQVHIPKEYAEAGGQVLVDKITREDILNCLINFTAMKNNPDYYEKVLEFNDAVDSNHLFDNRLRLGSHKNFVIFRNGEPDKIEKDGFKETYTYNDGDSYTVFKLTPKNNDSSEIAVTSVSIHPGKADFKGGEMLFNIGLLPAKNEYLKKSQVEDYLGEPKMVSGNTAYYRIDSGLSDYLYFTYSDDGELIEYGLWQWIIG